MSLQNMFIRFPNIHEYIKYKTSEIVTAIVLQVIIICQNFIILGMYEMKTKYIQPISLGRIK